MINREVRLEERAEKYRVVLGPLGTEYKVSYLCCMNVLRTASNTCRTFTCNNYNHAIDAVANAYSFQAVLLLTEKIYYHSTACAQAKYHEILMCVCEELLL